MDVFIGWLVSRQVPLSLLALSNDIEPRSHFLPSPVRSTGLLVVSCHLDTHRPLPVEVGLIQQEVGAELDLGGPSIKDKEVPMTHGVDADL